MGDRIPDALRRIAHQDINSGLSAIHNFLCRRRRPGHHKQMHMIWLNSQFNDVPALFLTLGFSQRLTIPCYPTHQDSLPSFGCPYELIGDEVNVMLVALIIHTISVEMIVLVIQNYLQRGKG